MTAAVILRRERCKLVVPLGGSKSLARPNCTGSEAIQPALAPEHDSRFKIIAVKQTD